MLTQRQLQLLTFIHDYYQDEGLSPSYDEMRLAMGLKSKSGIHRLVSSLEERGFIRRLAYRARAVEILKPIPGLTAAPAVAEKPGENDEKTPVPASEASNVVHGHFKRAPSLSEVRIHPLPLVGRIAAGSPIEAIRGHNGEVDVPSMMIGHGDHYVLEVDGDSMIDAGILDGDLAVIQECESAPNGTIVVALIEGEEVTLKRLRRRGASIALEPANPAYETRIFNPQQVKVQGQLVGLLRRY